MALNIGWVLLGLSISVYKLTVETASGQHLSPVDSILFYFMIIMLPKNNFLGKKRCEIISMRYMCRRLEELSSLMYFSLSFRSLSYRHHLLRVSEHYLWLAERHSLASSREENVNTI